MLSAFTVYANYHFTDNNGEISQIFFQNSVLNFQKKKTFFEMKLIL